MIARLSGVSLKTILDRRGLLALCAGLLIALSFPSPGLSFLAWFALFPLLVALEESSPRTAFRIGFMAGCSAYAVILYWINIVMTQYGHLPWGISLVLYLLVMVWLAMFYGLASLVARCGELCGVKSVFSLPVAWVAFDYIRSFLMTGIPWTMLGHSQYRLLPLIQIADLAGVYGITFLIVLANVVLYRALRAVSGAGVPYPAKSALVLLVLFAVTIYHGFSCLNDRAENGGKPVRVALIQGNIPQDVKWSPEFRERTISVYERLTREAFKDGTDLIVWPESAVPFFFQDEPLQADRLRGLARAAKASLYFGSPAHELRNDRRTFLNSAYLLGPNGETVGRADKLHLVPFGEYVPLAGLLPFVSKMVEGIGDFSPGTQPVVLEAAGTRLGTLVCYEVVFPELARSYVRAGARVLVTITNDAWFGRSSAPWQHLSMAVFRAVENRTPLIRAANTGISAIVDRNGHISAMTGLFEEASLTGEITPGSGTSFYNAYGDLGAWLCLLLTAGIVAWSCRRKKTTT